MTTIEQRLDALEGEITELKAAGMIRSLLSDYAVAVDEKRRNDLGSLFTDDAQVIIPAWDVSTSGRDAILAFYDTYWARFDRPRRYFANEKFQIDGDVAECFMYWHVTQDSEQQSWLGWGTYNWRFRAVDGRWLIAAVTIDIKAMTTLALGWANSENVH